MLRLSITIATIISAGITAPVRAGDAPRTPTIIPAAANVVSPGQKAPTVLDCIEEKHREAVATVLKNPTISSKATDEEFVAHEKVYDWCLAHPDRVSLAWQRLKVACVEIEDKGNGKYHWADESGSELNWQAVGKFENGVIWYATGKVKAGALLPSVPVKAVAVLHAPRKAVSDKEEDGWTFKPTVNIYLLTDSRTANMVLRMVGPAAPKMAEQGAEQLMFFFSGVARYIQKKPDQMPTLLAAKKK